MAVGETGDKSPGRFDRRSNSINTGSPIAMSHERKATVTLREAIVSTLKLPSNRAVQCGCAMIEWT
jgi:hypothetical protein